MSEKIKLFFQLWVISTVIGLAIGPILFQSLGESCLISDTSFGKLNEESLMCVIVYNPIYTISIFLAIVSMDFPPLFIPLIIILIALLSLPLNILLYLIILKLLLNSSRTKKGRLSSSKKKL